MTPALLTLAALLLLGAAVRLPKVRRARRLLATHRRARQEGARG